MSKISRLIKTYSPTRIAGALRRRGGQYLRKWQYRPQATKALKNQVFFESFQGKVIGDNPYDIFVELKRVRPDLKFVWTTGPGTKAPEGATGVRFGSREWLDALATSKYLVNNTNWPWYFRKVPGQVYLQTWHGTPLKRLGREIPNNNLTKSYLDTMDREALAWDYLISPNGFCTKVFPGAFGYRGNIIETGYPRNDRLTTSTAADRVAKALGRLGIPTARDLQALGAQAVLLKGGHLPGPQVTDVLLPRGPAGQARHWHSERVPSRNTHGTGCTLSSALATHLALTGDALAAAKAAKTYTLGAIQGAARLTVGHGHGPTDHFFAQRT